MKILYFIHGSYLEGGASISVFETINQLKKHFKFDVFVFIKKKSSDSIKNYLFKNKINFQPLPQFQFDYIGKYITGWISDSQIVNSTLFVKDLFFSTFLIPSILFKIKKIKPNIIVFNSINYLPLAFVINIFFRKIRLILHVRENLFIDSISNISIKIFNFLCKKISNTELIYNSPVEKKNYNYLFQINFNKQHILKIPISNKLYNLKSKLFKYDVPKNKFIISYFGGYDKKKGIIYTLKSILNIEKEIIFYLCGNNNTNKKLQQKINFLINKIKLKKNINLIQTGIISNPFEIIDKSNIVISTHIKPHGSRVILESFYANKPLAAIKDEYTIYTNKISKNSIFFLRLDNYFDLNNLINKFSKLKRQNIENKLKNGKNYVSNHHNFNKILNGYVSILKKND